MREQNRRLMEAIKRKKAVIWDFDGVLCFADWEYGTGSAGWWEAMWALLEEYDPGVRARFSGGLKYYYEHTDYIVGKFGEEARMRINALYLSKELEILPASPVNTELTELIAGMDPEVEQYVWSNNQSPFIMGKLEESGIGQKFREIVSRDKVVLAKPNLHGYDLIKPKTDVKPEDFLFVGDSRNTDKVAAAALGMEFFLYDPSDAKI